MLVQPIFFVDQIVVIYPMLIEQVAIQLIVYGKFVVDPYATKVEVGPQFVLEV